MAWVIEIAKAFVLCAATAFVLAVARSLSGIDSAKASNIIAFPEGV